MNWQDYPHLFANGKFKLKYKTDKPQVFNNEGLRIAQNPKFINDCTLIARKIEDMTDEERDGIGSFGSSIWDDPSEDLDFYQVVYLLSIGVYPFDQNDFETGEVLDAKEAV